MKIQYFSLIFGASVIGASAQGLFNLVPTDISTESKDLPLTWTLGADFGYDDNANTGNGSALSPEQDSVFTRGFVQAAISRPDARTPWNLSARLGAIYYFENVSGNEDINSDSAINFDLRHEISDRLRYTNRSSLAFQAEPDFTNDLAAARRVGEYLHWSTDNSFGYEISPRYGVVVGHTFTGLNYVDNNALGEDRISNMLHTQLRLKASERTVWTAGYRYEIVDRDFGSDNTSQFLTVGTEHRISPTSVVIANVGAQFRDVDGGTSSTSPFGEFGLRTQLSEKLSLNWFSRLSQESGENTVGVNEYDYRLVFRNGATLSFQATEKISIDAGLTYVKSSWEDARNGGSDIDEDLVNAHLGFNYQLYSNFSIVGNYNFSSSNSDQSFRDYDRNRVMIGVRTTF